MRYIWIALVIGFFAYIYQSNVDRKIAKSKEYAIKNQQQKERFERGPYVAN